MTIEMIQLGIVQVNHNFSKAVVTSLENPTKKIEINGWQRIGPVFTGDTVEVDHDESGYRILRVIGSPVRSGEVTILGVLKFTSQYRYPANDHGVPQYLFSPLKREYPDFLVATNSGKKKKKSGLWRDRYVLIKYKSWKAEETCKSCDGHGEGDIDKTRVAVRPLGSIEQMIGAVGDPIAEYWTRAHYHEVAFNKLKLGPETKLDGVMWPDSLMGMRLGLETKIDPRDLFPEVIRTKSHRDITDLTVYSIDPAGSRDLDDAFSFEEISTEAVRVGVHIADLGFYLKKFGLVQRELFRDRYSTLYLPEPVGPRHMIPDFLAVNMASLLPDHPRLAWSLWLTVHPVTGALLREPEFERTIICSKKAWSYEEADQKIVDQSTNVLTRLAQISGLLADSLLGWKDVATSTIDSHKMIEILMVTTNHLVAKKLQAAGATDAIYRVHQANDTNEDEDLGATTDDTCEIKIESAALRDFMGYLKSQSAIYTYVDSSSISERSDISHLQDRQYFHHGLQLNGYAHFTSPIRRLVDVHNHLLLEKILSLDAGEGNPKVAWNRLDLDKINSFNRRQKRLARDLDYLQLVYWISARDKGNQPAWFDAYLIDLGGDETTQIACYLPAKCDDNDNDNNDNDNDNDNDEMNGFRGNLLICFQPLMDDWLKTHLITLENRKSEIVFMHTDRQESLSLPKYQKVEIGFSANPNAVHFRDKLRVTLPGLSELICS